MLQITLNGKRKETMANVIKKATNKFTKGLVMDFSPENTQNEVLTHALNATLLTFNGNELSLQNDMGNARVETAFLPEGYIPVGTCEYGGIIYIVSYNPLEDKSQIGCFPSPERNISNDELGLSDVLLNSNSFIENGNIKNSTYLAILKKDKLNPGDKFIVHSSSNIYKEFLADLFIQTNGKYKAVEHPVLSLNIVSIEDSGKIVYLNSSVKQYEYNVTSKENPSQTTTYKYHILGEQNTQNTQNTKPDIDSYRNVLSSGYSVFRSKTSGKLAILAELIMIDSYSVTHSIKPNEEENIFDVIIHTEVEPSVTTQNFVTVPKLKYYYLKNSQGTLETATGNKVLYTYSDNSITDNTQNIKSTAIKDIFQLTTDEDGNLKESLNKSLEDCGFALNFPKGNTYHTNTSQEELLELPSYSDFLARELKGDYLLYEDVKLGYITIPPILQENGLDLPFTYDYTLTPCMIYGKLDHLSVSNTVDFKNLHAFNKSNFTTWKYRIDNNQLRLTFGAEIFDTFETDKVDGLVFEFYDLWGFAGSLEISNKKSYSGIFTKILALNSPKELSNRKISGNTFVTTYKHNINIIETKPQEYTLNKKDISYQNDDLGWQIDDDNLNDCGTLYSGILYGVKTYLKRTTNQGQEFIQKDNFFLYTIPIFNDYYYQINNFNVLKNPELEFVLTYQIQDNSSKNSYNEGDIKDGYCLSDKGNIDLYFSGNYKKDSLDVIKYYKYSGTSQLALEIGLDKKYESFNLSYSTGINQYYSCKLQLISGDKSNKSWSISSSDNSKLSEEQILNYYNTDSTYIDLENNYVKFIDDEVVYSINDGVFQSYNFTYNKGQTLDIKYEFIVGYKAFVQNIHKTQVPATTVCALYHKNDDGEWNHSDFGIYPKNIGDNTYYLSETMLYNSGTVDEEVFGICMQNTIKGDDSPANPAISQEIASTSTFKQPATDIRSQGLLNSNAPLAYISQFIGKLSFCQPHAHAIDLVNGSTIDAPAGDSSQLFLRNPDKDYRADLKIRLQPGRNDDERFAHYQKNPKYNLCLNTISSIDKHWHFYSALDWATMADPYNSGYIVRKYTGFTGEEVAIFNQRLLNTMKSVYAYNPDYDVREVNAGQVTLQNYYPKFTSYLINSNSQLNENINLNDFIYLGNIQFSRYLHNLQFFSTTLANKINTADIKFVANLEKCGTEEAPYLINTLVYNTPVPNELALDLEFKDSSKTVVRHSDNTYSYIEGVPNKKTLYGYVNVYNKLLSLDVSNYSIDYDGTLTVSSGQTITVTNNYTSPFNKQSKTETTLDGKSLDITFDIKPGPSCRFYETTDESSTYFIRNFSFPASFELKGTCSDPSVTVDINEFTCKIKSCVFDSSDAPPNWQFKNDDLFSESKIKNFLEHQLLINEFFQNLEFKKVVESEDITCTKPKITVSFKCKNNSGTKDPILDGSGQESIGGNTNLTPSFTFDPELISKREAIFQVVISDINYTLTKSNDIKNLKENIIHVQPTTDYYTHGESYQVKDKFKQAKLCKSSITLNDLQYDPQKTGHRLYMKDSLYQYNAEYVGKIYYRTLNDFKGEHDSWHFNTWPKNALWFYTGPCFTKDSW